MKFKKHEKNLLSFGSGLFVAVFFTSLILWVLGNKLGNIYLFLGFVIYYSIDHLIIKKNNSQRLNISVNSFVFGLGLILFFQVGIPVGIILSIPALIYVILSYKKFSKSLVISTVGAILAASLLYFKLPFVEILSLISGALFYIVARYMMFESMDKKLAFLLGVIVGIIPFIMGV